ncbi:MAG: hypothetical protein ACKVHU_17160 [Acidimicrobiales bacterium]
MGKSGGDTVIRRVLLAAALVPSTSLALASTERETPVPVYIDDAGFNGQS